MRSVADRVRHGTSTRVAWMGTLVGLLAVTGLSRCTLDFPEQWLTQNCGDGILDDNEACDDGDTFSGNGCSDTCQVERGYYCDGEPSDCTTQCGDGLQAGPEECDDGNLDPGDGCSPACRIETGDCGDGNIDANEGCDDANTTGGDGCSATCQTEDGWDCVGVPSQCSPTCGDGVRVTGEECDDQNLTAGDGCNALCQVEHGFHCTGSPSVCVASCGDGVVASVEGCDDGQDPPMAGDGCDDSCQVEAGWSCSGEPSACSADCGDGFINGVETCDDSNIADGDGCSGTCQEEAGWTCTGEPSVCGTTCGDGVTAGLETCDDGDTPPAAGDGCDDSCQVEPDWTCDNTSSPSVCAGTCGDGTRIGDEALATGCDDGNTTPGDGCDATCSVEPGFGCTDVPALVPQTGCAAGEMCTVDRSGPSVGCHTAGSIAPYTPCTAWGQCAPGAYCLSTVDQGQFCAPWCNVDADCGTDSLCLYQFDSTDTGGGSIGLCSHIDNCDATLGGVAAGCASGAGCYLVQIGTYCMTPQGTGALGSSCSHYNDCAAGASCLNFGNPGDPACYEMCDTQAGSWTCQTGGYSCYGLTGVDRWGACLP